MRALLRWVTSDTYLLLVSAATIGLTLGYFLDRASS